jgi:hypothetical protein
MKKQADVLYVDFKTKKVTARYVGLPLKYISNWSCSGCGGEFSHVEGAKDNDPRMEVTVDGKVGQLCANCCEFMYEATRSDEDGK